MADPLVVPYTVPKPAAASIQSLQLGIPQTGGQPGPEAPNPQYTLIYIYQAKLGKGLDPTNTLGSHVQPEVPDFGIAQGTPAAKFNSQDQNTELQNLNPATLLASIALPMPIQYAAAYGADWYQDQIGTAEQLVAAGAQGAAQAWRSQSFTDLASFAGKQAAGWLEEEATRYAYSSVFRKFAREQGLAVNPRKELFYSGPTFRTFTLNWNFSFTTQKDSKAYALIVETLLKSMHPDYLSSLQGVAGITASSTGFGGAWKLPDTFGVTFVNCVGVRQPGSLVLTSLVDDSTASGTWRSFTDGRPAHVGLQLTFMEMAPLIKPDIDAGH